MNGFEKLLVKIAPASICRSSKQNHDWLKLGTRIKANTHTHLSVAAPAIDIRNRIKAVFSAAVNPLTSFPFKEIWKVEKIILFHSLRQDRIHSASFSSNSWLKLQYMMFAQCHIQPQNSCVFRGYNTSLNETCVCMCCALFHSHFPWIWDLHVSWK